MTAHHIGIHLARLRRARGMTQERLAEQAGVSVDVIRRLEQRRKNGVRLETLRRLAQALDSDVDAILGPPEGQQPDGYALTGQPDASRGHDEPVDPALIPYFRQQLDGHYRADMLLGPRALIGTVTAQCDLIGQLVDSATGRTRSQMAMVGTSYATFAAWLHLDAGDIPAALRWHNVAQEWAHRSCHREAVACALVDRAMARTDQGLGVAVVDLCAGALVDARRLPAELRVFALQQQAHGASLLGDRRQADALLDLAGRLIDRVDAEVWGTACLRTPHYVEVQRATCYGRLGAAEEAEALWHQIIPAAPPSSRRDVGVWMARQASACAAMREPERAVDLARHAAEATLETGSARASRELAAVGAAMAPWEAEPVGQDLRDVLAAFYEGM